MKKNIIGIAGLIVMLVSCGKVFSPLNSSQPAATSAKRYPGLVDDFESGVTLNDLGQTNVTETDTFVHDSAIANTPPGPSTMSAMNTPGSTLLGGTPGNAVRLVGTVQTNTGWNQPGPNGTITGGNYPFAFFQVNLSNPVTGYNVTPLAPKRTLTFSYKSSTADIGQVHRVTIQNAIDVQAPNYEFYTSDFVPTNTLWTAVTVDFPPLAYVNNPCLGPSSATNPTCNYPPFFWPAVCYGSCTAGGLPAWLPWSYVQNNVTSILFQPFAGSTSPFVYDFSIDDVRFQ